MGPGLENRVIVQVSYFFMFVKLCHNDGLVRRSIIVKKFNKLKSILRASFLIILFEFLFKTKPLPFGTATWIAGV